MRFLALLILLAPLGCGTTRMTDTKRAASEMLLVSAAIDSAVARIDFTPLRGQTVFLEEKYIDSATDEGYYVSSLRQRLLEHGAMLKDNKKDATYIVEARAGGIGTDRHSLLIGTPAVTLPSITAIPVTSIPEIALVKKTDQKGIAKLAVFAYHRETGAGVWLSGTVESSSNLKDSWVFGVGPFSRGTIRKETELAGEPLPKIPNYFPNVTGTHPTEPKPETVPSGAIEPVTPKDKQNDTKHQ